MKVLILIALSSASVLAQQHQQQHIGSIRQKSSGPCTVNSAGIQDNVEVTINCPGVDPRAMRFFNQELCKQTCQISEQGGQIANLAEKITAAEEWRKKYEELTERLANAGIDAVASHRAEELVHEGRLDEAEKVLGDLIKDDEQEVDRAARDHYNRAQLYELKFEPLKALGDYAEAYHYRRANPDYAMSYDVLLLKQNEYGKAEDVLTNLLTRLRDAAKTNPAAYQPYVARTLNNLALVQLQTGDAQQARGEAAEALAIYRGLWKVDPAAQADDLARSLEITAMVLQKTGGDALQ